MAGGWCVSADDSYVIHDPSVIPLNFLALSYVFLIGRCKSFAKDGDWFRPLRSQYLIIWAKSFRPLSKYGHRLYALHDKVSEFGAALPLQGYNFDPLHHSLLPNRAHKLTITLFATSSDPPILWYYYDLPTIPPLLTPRILARTSIHAKMRVAPPSTFSSSRWRLKQPVPNE